MKTIIVKDLKKEISSHNPMDVLTLDRSFLTTATGLYRTVTQKTKDGIVKYMEKINEINDIDS